MPRDIKKIKLLTDIINNQAQEIAKYKQLIANINGLINISELGDIKGDWEERKLTQLRPNWFKPESDKPFYKNDRVEWTIEEQAQHLLKGLEREGLQLTINPNSKNKVVIIKNDDTSENKNELDKLIEGSKELGNYDFKQFMGNDNAKKYKEQQDETEKPTERIRKKKGDKKEQPKVLKSDEGKEAPNCKLCKELIKDTIIQEPNGDPYHNNCWQAKIAREKGKGVDEETGQPEVLTQADETEDGDEQLARLRKLNGEAPPAKPINKPCLICKELLDGVIIEGKHKECYDAEEARLKELEQQK